MAENAQISISNTIKVTENAAETVSQVSSGVISVNEYVTYNDIIAPSTVKKVYTFGASPTYDFISLEVDGLVSVYFESSGTEIPLSPSIVSGTKVMGKMIISSSALSYLSVSNADTEASVKIKITLAKYA